MNRPTAIIHASYLTDCDKAYANTAYYSVSTRCHVGFGSPCAKKQEENMQICGFGGPTKKWVDIVTGKPCNKQVLETLQFK